MSATPSTAAISIAWEDARTHLHGKRANEARAEFDQWLAFHDAAIVRSAVNEHETLAAKVAEVRALLETPMADDTWMRLNVRNVRELDAAWRENLRTILDREPTQ